ncbi:MAG TPA: hypothetical protein V6D12_14955 [Candidatus Obscuribacterales bacterium]
MSQLIYFIKKEFRSQESAFRIFICTTARLSARQSLADEYGSTSQNQRFSDLQLVVQREFSMLKLAEFFFKN